MTSDEEVILLSASDKLQQHTQLKFCLLDWFEALNNENIICLKTLLREIDPETIVGADLASTKKFGLFQC